MIKNGIKRFFIKGEDAMKIRTVMTIFPGRVLKGLTALAIAWSISLTPLPSGAVDLMHNSDPSGGTGSTKWAAQGGWGVTGGKYGKFECSTCHEPNKKPNIKNVRRVITTQNGENWPNGSSSAAISFSNVTSMGEDAGGHSTSSRICEACHSQNKFHNANTANNIANGGNLSHPTPKAICTSCHKHNTGFKAACGGCHGNPPTEAVIGGDTGLVGTPRPSNALTSGQAGAHVTHTETRGMVCDTCHYINNGGIKMPNLSNSIDIGFFGFGGKVTSGTYVPYSSTNRGYRVASGTANTTIATVVTDYTTANICSNVYCHGGGVKVGATQVKVPLTGGSNQNPRWDAASQNQCGSCHGTTPATPPTMGSHVKHSGSTGYSFSCDLCHPAIDVTHVQGRVRWGMKTSDSRVGAAAAYKAAGSLEALQQGATNDLAPSAAYGQCYNLYCHSNGKGGTPRQDPTWGDGNYSTGCTNCHGNNAGAVSTMASNGHKAHVANTSARFGGFDFRCQECHNATVNATDTAVISTSLHVNAAADVAWGPDASYVPNGGTSTLPYNSAQTCTVYCHSNGQGKYKAPPQTWNTIGDNQEGTIECNYCHNGLAGVQNQMSSGRHLNHINGGPLPHRPIACNWCHSNTVASNGQSVYNGTDVKHINRTIDVSFIKMANFSGSYSTSNHVCSNTYCHTNNATTSTRDWDTTTVNTCGNCHEANNTTTASATLSPAHRKHYNRSTRPSNTTEQGWTNVNLSASTNIFMCGICHPGTPTTSHLNGPPAGVTNGSVAEVAIRLPFTPPVGATRPEIVTRGTGVNYDGRGYGYSTGTTCDTYCHSDGRGNPGKRNSTSTPRLEWTTATGVVCGNCHNQYGDANPTWSGSHTKHLSGSRSTNATCNACHAATAADNTTLIAGRRDKHPNGFRNVTGNSIAGAFRWDSSVQQCTNVYCHFNKPVTWGGSLPAGCIGCHGYNAGSGDPIATKGHTAHVNNTSTRFGNFNFKCNECHASTVNAFDNVTAVSLHANRVNNVSWGAKSTGGLAYATNGCTQIYCHSNGTGVYKAPPTTWNNIAEGQQGTIECNYCHNGLAGIQRQMSTGRHINHINAGPLPHRPVTCNWCHSGTVASNGQSVYNGTDVKHINRTIDVSFIKMANFSGSYSTSNHVCANTYCHTNNATTSTRDWDTATVNTCGNCHEANNTTTASATLSPAHRKHYNRSTRPSNTTEQGWTNVNLSASTNIFMCGTCHPGSPAESHINGPPAGVTNGSVAEVIMRPPFSTPQGAGRPETVFRGTGVNYDGRGYGYSTGTSCDTYCHSDGRGGLGKRNYANTAFTPVTSVLRWTGRAAACGDCHNKASDNPATTTWSLPHNKHANTYGNGGTIGSNNTTTNNTLVTCAACHASTASSNTALVSGSRAKHPNGFRNISASSTVGSAAFRWDPANNQCKNGYCHSRAYSFTDYSTPSIKWDTVQADIHCGSCHNSYPVGPDYANGYKGKANSHPKHAVFWGFTCDWCHNGTTTTGNTITNVRNHVNKNYNVVANGTKTFIGKANTFTATATTNPPSVKTTCTNVNCHGGNTSTVFTWGGTNKCSDCHLTTAADTINYAFKNSTMATINSVEWTYSGHGKASGTYDVTGSNAANFPGAAGTGDPCLYCHDYDVIHGDSGNPLRLRNFADPAWGKNGVCLICHATGQGNYDPDGTGPMTAKGASKKIDKYHYGSKHSTTLNSGQFCWDCHDSHGDRNSTNAGPIAMVHLKPAVTSDGVTGIPTSFTASNVSFVAKSAGADFGKTSSPFNGICNVCHTYKAADPNKMVHFTATNSDAIHNTTTVCTQCHLHSSTTTYDGTAYKGDPKVCDGCHDGNNNGGLSPGIAGTPATNAGHAIHYNQATVFNHYTGNNKHTATAYGFACKNCHVKTLVNHQNGGTAEMLGSIGYVQGGTSTPDGRDYNYYNADTCGTNSCHQDGRLGTPQTTSFAWSGTRTSNCGKCHVDMSSSASATGSHVKHAQASGIAYACSTCHGTGYGSTAIFSPTHVNNQLTLSFTGSAAGTTYQKGTSFPLGTAFDTCTVSYCHSNVQGTNGSGVPTSYKTTPVWGNAASLACSACHTDMTASGSGTHLKHTAKYVCATCHSTAGSGTVKHADGFIDVTFSGAGAGSAYTQSRTAAGSDGSGTCSNIACHYNGTATWGVGTLACVSCHPLATLQANGAHGKHVSAVPTFYNFTANRSTLAAYNYGCSNCHPQDSLLHANGSVNVTLNAANTGGGGNAGSLRARNSATADGLAASNGPSGIYGTTRVSVRCSAAYCHSNGYAVNLKYMITPDWYGPAYTGDKCAMCHGNSPNANDPLNQPGSPAHYSKNFLGFANVSGGHLRGIHTNQIFTGTIGLAPAGNTATGSHGNAGTSTTINCNICHNKTVTSSANDKNVACVACHTALPKNPADLIADKRFHVSGNVDVSFASIRVKSKAQLRSGSYDAAIWSRQVGYKVSGAYDAAFKTFTTATQWDSATKTCSNISCHNGKTVKWGDTGGTTSCASCHSSL